MNGLQVHEADVARSGVAKGRAAAREILLYCLESRDPERREWRGQLASNPVDAKPSGTGQ